MSHIDNQPVQPQDHPAAASPEARKPYGKPEIVHELTLETRAGSPLPGGHVPTALDQFDPRRKH
ncbi:MAG TPA: hypothetical protein VGE07_14445 [Herpetosiphonaceae bacterium]